MHFDWTYAIIMAAAVGTGFVLFRRAAAPLGLRFRQIAGIALGAFCGSMIGAKLPFVLADWQGFLSGAAWFHDGKTILAGLVGGYIGAELAEWALGIREPLCDVFAAPVAAAIGIGRFACFHAGCCYGTVTSLAWGVDFGDGQRRHPTQLYEAAFHLSAAVVLYQLAAAENAPRQSDAPLLGGLFSLSLRHRIHSAGGADFSGLDRLSMGGLGAGSRVCPVELPRLPADGHLAAAQARTETHGRRTGGSSAQGKRHALPEMPRGPARHDLPARRSGLPAARCAPSTGPSNRWSVPIAAITIFATK